VYRKKPHREWRGEVVVGEVQACKVLEEAKGGREWLDKRLV
jgi:hypothetical protein